MNTLNLPIIEPFITKPNDFSEATGVSAVHYYFDKLKLTPKKDIEAIICVSDLVALGVSNALSQRNIEIPSDIALVGFNNTNQSLMCHPPITTVAPNLANKGVLASELLIQKILDIDTYQQQIIYVDTNLLIRHSCGCLENTSEFFHLNLNEQTISAIKEQLDIIAQGTLAILEDNWIHTLIDNFLLSLYDTSSIDFISFFEKVLDKLKDKSENISMLHLVITEMRKSFTALINDPSLILRASNLWNQARVQIHLAFEYILANNQNATDKLLFSLHATNQTLMATYNRSELYTAIERLLLELGIPGCYISLYEDEQTPLKKGRLIFAFRDFSRISIDKNGIIFNPKDLIPQEIKPTSRYTMILHPLYFKDIQLGFALFEVGPLNKATYHIFCSEISTALHRIMMFEELKKSEAERAKLLLELEKKNQELEKRIEERTADIQKVNEQLQIAIKEANAASDAKTRFLANMSHEIRTPLNCIIGFAEILDNTQDLDQKKNYTHLIIDESEKLIDLINQILDLSKIEFGKLTLHNEPFDLIHLLEALTSTYSTTAQNKGLSYYCEVDPTIPQTLMGDALRLRQILVNLVGNAIKFTKDGGIKISVQKLNESANQLTLIFKISDTGIGIPKERQPSIFDIFVQSEDSTTRNYGGTGLGTSIAKQLVELMHGDIGVESEVNKGSTFWFTASFQTLPINHHQITDAIENKLNTLPISESYKHFRILLAEDYPTNRKLALTHLRQIGCTIDIAENGLKALEKFKERPYDLILMDVQMPEMDGIEATKEIRKLPNGNSVYIIGLTANAFESDVIQYMQAGMDDIITKPFRKTSFLNKVLYWLTNDKDITKNSNTSIDKHQEILTNEKVGKQPFKPIDFYDILNEFDNDLSFVCSMTDYFTTNVKEELKTLSQAVNNSDFKTTYEIAHKIKGAALNLSARPFAELARQLEEKSKLHNIQISKLLIQELMDELNRLENYLKTITD
jgi:signal transduction histidine kinase/FixJ family two-component response regulator